MELLLNLFWLLLVLPAFWLWRISTRARSRQQRRSSRCLLILGSVLVLLFPVVSATDDLQAMRPELEEAGMQDGLRNSGHGKFSALLDGTCNAFALLAARMFVAPDHAVRGYVVLAAASILGVGLIPTRAGRAPPFPSSAS
jgi:hypothetical protein